MDLNNIVANTKGNSSFGYMALLIDTQSLYNMASQYDFSFMRDEIRLLEAATYRDEIRSLEAASYFDRVVGEYFSGLIRQGDDNLIVNLRSRFESISQIYRMGLRGTGKRPDWTDVGNRCTYVYRFFAMHSYMVYKSLQLALADKRHVTSIWKYKPTFRVCCIGGGPGSDVAGLTKFLRDTGLVETDRLECSVFDMYFAWAMTWQDIRKSNPMEFPGIRYGYGDLTLPGYCLRAWSSLVVSQADIITFVKFFSTVAAFMRNDYTNGAQLREIFRTLSPGALVLYIDNRYASQHREFQHLASSEGVTELLFEWHGEIRLPSSGSSSVLRSIKLRTGFEPIERCTVSVMLLRKPHPKKTTPLWL